jgi:hypothetical protein
LKQDKPAIYRANGQFALHQASPIFKPGDVTLMRLISLEQNTANAQNKPSIADAISIRFQAGPAYGVAPNMARCGAQTYSPESLLH